MKIINCFSSVFFILLSISTVFAEPVNIKKVENEVSKLLQDDWLDIVSYGETLGFCSSYLIKTNNQLSIIEAEKKTYNELIHFLATEKIKCSTTSKKDMLVRLAKRAKQIMRQFGISPVVERKWLEMRPYYIDRELYDAVTKDDLDRYLHLLAYGAYYGNIAIGHSVISLALANESYNIVGYLFKKKHIGLNWIARGHPAPLTLLIDHKKVRYDLLEYALKKLKADPNHNADQGRLPLTVAFNRNDAKAMALLIKYRAKVNINSRNGFTCSQGMLMDQAIKKGKKKIIHLLRKAGAKSYKECKDH